MSEITVVPIRLAAQVMYAERAAEKGVEFAGVCMSVGRGKAPTLRGVVEEYGIPADRVRTWKDVVPYLRMLQDAVDADLGLPVRVRKPIAGVADQVPV